ncbi:zinc finger protein 567-like, partial [Sipha flava]|uniref:Zinc finger protein 567-like n=1 Tax=Sipha flava TaxID=143950 RepID=A0A8B8GAJ9_9HEMI
FSSQQQLDLHERSHEPYIRYECPNCKKLFKKEIKLFKHWESHTDRRRFRCNICEKNCLLFSTLRKHLKKRHDQTDFSNYIRYELSLPQHYKKVLVTDDADDSSDDKWSHYSKKYEEFVAATPYACQYCSNRFTHQDQLDIHERGHQHPTAIDNELNQSSKPEESSALQYCCQYCTEQFSSREQLVRHEPTHDPYIRYQCPICNKLFKEEENLFKHHTLHGIKREYMCSICHKKFNSVYILNHHLKMHHNRIDYNNCTRYERNIPKNYNIVLVSSDSSDSIEPTKKDTNSPIFEVPNIQSSDNLHSKPDESKILQYCCPLCTEQFNTQEQFDLHERTHEPYIRYQCPECNKLFKKKSYLSKHYASHIGKRKYACNICDGRFSYLNNLKFHMYKRHDLIKYAKRSRYISGKLKYYTKVLLINDSNDLSEHMT